MAIISDSLIEEIIKLGDGSIKDQKKACGLIKEKIFIAGTCIDGSVIPKLLPLIVKLITCENQYLQRFGVYYVEKVTCTSDSFQNYKENTQLAIDHNATENLVKCLSTSHNKDVIHECLMCLLSISEDFPAEIIKHNALPSIIECLKSKKPEIVYRAAEILGNIAKDCEENILPILEAGGIDALKCLLESSLKNLGLFEVALAPLVSIMSFNAEACQRVLDLGILNSIETSFVRLYDDTKKRRSTFNAKPSDENETRERVHILAIRFILNATYFNEKQIEMVLDKNILPSIFKQIGGNASNEIKNISILVIENIIEKKPSFIPNLINNGIISLLYKNFETEDSELLKTVLRTFYDFILHSGYDESVRQSIRRKIIECGNPEKLENLLQREDLKEFPKDIHNFVYVKLEPDAIEKVEANEFDDQGEAAIENAFEFDGLTDVDVQVKTQANESNEQNEDEQGPVVDTENVIENDFDDSHVEVERLPTDVQNVVVGNVKVEPGIIVKHESSEFSEQVVVRSATIDIQNGTRGSKRPLNASEQDEPVSKQSRSGESSNENVSSKSSTNQRPAIVPHPPLESNRDSENAITPSSATAFPCLPEATTSDTINRHQNAFASIKYFVPSEADIVKYCETLNLDFDRKKFLEFFSNFDFETITSDSKPTHVYPTNDKSGFGCFSLFFTGTESYAEEIRNKVVDEYIDFSDLSENSSKEKLKQIVKSTSMTPEHLETIVRWLNCRIMLYSDENGWEKYGDWDSENKYVPIFVLKKIQSGNDRLFEIVLSFN